MPYSQQEDMACGFVEDLRGDSALFQGVTFAHVHGVSVVFSHAYHVLFRLPCSRERYFRQAKICTALAVIVCMVFHRFFKFYLFIDRHMPSSFELNFSASP